MGAKNHKICSLNLMLNGGFSLLHTEDSEHRCMHNHKPSPVQCPKGFLKLHGFIAFWCTDTNYTPPMAF